jgi:hypothetical protein
MDCQHRHLVFSQRTAQAYHRWAPVRANAPHGPVRQTARQVKLAGLAAVHATPAQTCIAVPQFQLFTGNHPPGGDDARSHPLSLRNVGDLLAEEDWPFSGIF